MPKLMQSVFYFYMSNGPMDFRKIQNDHSYPGISKTQTELRANIIYFTFNNNNCLFIQFKFETKAVLIP